MEIPSKFSPQTIESKWYEYWQKNNYFKSVPDNREPYTIVIPPPNVTGVLHMGHMLNNSLQDIIIRRARMRGYNACWVPGTDHASIATEAKVVEKLKEEGIEKDDLTREAFLEYAWDWTNKYGGVILEQLKKLGCSCDWDRTKFTLDPDMYESVIKVFIDLYEKGQIYRGFKIVNWDPKAQTTLSDEEVIYKEKTGKLYYIAYQVVGSNEKVIIATTRPETLLGDTAVCINPNDDRFIHLKGKHVWVPLTKRKVPVIEDEYVTMDFGTGCLKVTPAHDLNDKALGEKHNLEIIDIFNSDATINEKGLDYEGMDRFEARKKIIKDLEAYGSVVKIESHIHKVGTSERTNEIIEPRLSYQWFLKTDNISKPAIEAVLNSGEIDMFPEKFKNTYRHWMENIRDWNISRQLWWGHRIPVYYYGDGNEDFVVAVSSQKALLKAKEKTNNQNLTLSDLKQDEDVLDTWFSSWLWPISVFDGIRNPKNSDVEYYYPTQDLVTGPDIIFFWVARMIMSGYEYRKEKPFSNIYFTGLVRDKKGQKMSKQLGNSPDALKLIDIYGADAVRVGLMLSSAAGNDLLFDENLCQQGKNFANKIWNAYRLIEGWKIDENINVSSSTKEALKWYKNKFEKTLVFVDENFEKYRISEALMSIYKLIWEDFCSWLLELIKPNYGQPINIETYNKIIVLFENNLRLLHPFMPFLTEELWHFIKNRKSNEALAISSWPSINEFDSNTLEEFEKAKEVIVGIRNFRKEKNISFKEKIDLFVSKSSSILPFEASIMKLGVVSTISYGGAPKDVFGRSFRVGTFELFIPSNSLEDSDTERRKINEELTYAKGFLASVEKKLLNKSFVSNAPEDIINIERKKMSDIKQKIILLEKSLSAL
ncbi:MAG: valine--tRNA ligase [Flavobacteriaceae bacterium TMED179]|nr:MAG: valine--tRNA ligase [Flavobacteriaceae bacterium TMED179]|tara:strand:+ start:8963 stop:11593 length:2631 start_codon:yes stop_codon:yes gene_type:complete